MLNKDLCLTAPDNYQQKYGNWIPSQWKLPGFFHNKCCSVLKGRGQVRDDDPWLVDIKGQWQEAVFDFDESDEFCRWFCSLLKQVVDNV